MIRTYQRAILGRLGGRKWDDLGGFSRDAELTPGFHHGAASLQSIIAPVGSLGGALDGVSEGKFGKLTGELGVISDPITERAPHAVDRDGGVDAVAGPA